ncbi:acyl carrier protein [Deltaproteobacteria bacterium]|nr:acyl carrier protein [Deltaproteobacteria bacterium]
MLRARCVEVGVELRQALKELIVRVLMLEGVRPEDIDTDAPLFGGALGLDSVDALELAIHIEEQFKVRMPDGEGAKEAWRSVESIARTIEG